jgi:hypothetical protein
MGREDASWFDVFSCIVSLSRDCVLPADPGGYGGADHCWEQASLDPKMQTVEDLEVRRKAQHMGMLKFAKQELSLSLMAGRNAFEVLPSAQALLSALS